MCTTVAFIAFLVLRMLTREAFGTANPDLIKVAGLARSFEPLIYYSENGVQHISDLQETGVAVWDLGESVRAANMTSAPLIVKELDDLSESLKSLSIELTTFFAAVDADIDNILLVMDWAKRELSALSTEPPSALSSALSNVHTAFYRIGVLSDSKGNLNTVGRAFQAVFGVTPTQRNRQTLQRTFVEFLSTLEESINSELTHTAKLFISFATIDKQFLNLQRATVREFDTQERLETEVLSSLWMRALGTQASRLRKYEKNKALLQNVRSGTVANKNMLVDHNGKLMALKQNLETLRRRLVGPLVKGEGSSGGIEEQIRGLDATHSYMRGVRDSQKTKVMDTLYGKNHGRQPIREIGN